MIMICTLGDLVGDDILTETIMKVAQGFQEKEEELRRKRSDNEGFDIEQMKVFLMDSMIPFIRLLLQLLGTSRSCRFSSWF
jgi:hypothetical protein